MVAKEGRGMVNALETDDAIVLLLGAPSDTLGQSDRIDGITRLEKLLFLLERETDVGHSLTEDLGFEAHNFGPFSSKTYQMIPILSAAGLVTDSSELADTTDDTWEYQKLIDDTAWDDDPYATRDVALTDLGKRYYRALLEELPDGTEDELRRFKTRFASIPLRQLVRYVYQKYPEFTGKSLIRQDILGT